MGLELILGVASLAVGAISGINQMNAANQSASFARESAAAQKESNTITRAQQQVSSLENRRQRIREERVRRAAMISGAAASGTSDSSGLSGALGALGSNYGTLVSQQYGETKSIEGINKYNQKSIDLDTEARVTRANADAFSSFMGIFQTGLNRVGNIFDN